MDDLRAGQMGASLIPVFAAPAAQRRLTCAMRWYSAAAGYGFAVPEDGGDEVMVHSCVLARDGILMVAEGALIDLEAIRTQKGYQALIVYSIDLGARRDDILAKRERKVSKHVLTVRWYNEAKGYGFGFADSVDGDVFIHAEALKRAGVPRLREGDRILALVAPGDRGQAVRTVYAPDPQTVIA